MAEDYGMGILLTIVILGIGAAIVLPVIPKVISSLSQTLSNLTPKAPAPATADTTQQQNTNQSTNQNTNQSNSIGNSAVSIQNTANQMIADIFKQAGMQSHFAITIA